MVDRVIKLEGRGLRGESFGDTARRVGEILGAPIPSNATDDQILDTLAASVAIAGTDTYPNTASGISATESGQTFWVADSSGLRLYRNNSGTASEISPIFSASNIGMQEGGTVQSVLSGQDSRLDDIVSQYNLPPPALPVAVIARDGGTKLDMYSPLHTPGFWDVHTLEAATAAERRPTTRKIVQLGDIYHALYDGTPGGTFGNDLLGEGSYIGGVSKATAASGAYIEWSVTTTGVRTVVELVFSKRDTANHIAVTIDGDTALVNLLPLNDAGERYIDAYDPSTDIVPRQRQAIAALPAGTYTIRVARSDEKNPAATGAGVFYPNALAVTGGSAGLPGGARTHAPGWQTGEAISTGWLRWHNGVTYRATTTGTTGGTPPTHDSGTETDGGVSWTPIADANDFYKLFEQVYLLDVSEPFYAIWLALNDSAEEDFGGDIHGNQTLTSVTVYSDGQSVTVEDYVPVYGSVIRVRQLTDGWHTVAPSTVVAKWTTDYSVMPGGDYRYDVEMTPLFSGLMGLFYPMMLPMYAYFVSRSRYLARRLQVPGFRSRNPQSFAGQSNPRFGESRAQQLGCLIQIGTLAGSAGVPNADQSGTAMLSVSAEIDRDSMFGFEQPGASSWWDANTSGVDASEGGFSGHLVKGYFRANNTAKVALTANVPMRWGGMYRSRLFDGRQAGNP